MSTLGMGACPIGSTAMGFGYTPPVTSTSAKLFVQPDGTRGDCGRISAQGGDWVVGVTGERVGWDSTSQRVYLALRTVLGSAAVETMGIDLPTDGVINESTITRIRLAVLVALKKLTTDGSITVVDIITTRAAVSGMQTEVRWRATGEPTIQSTFT